MMRSFLLVTLLALVWSPCLAQSAAEEPIRIFSDSLKIVDRTGVVQFEGNVRAQLSGATLSCDRLTVVTSPQNPSEVLSGTATGNIVVERGPEKLEAGKAHFDLDKATLDLTGSPSLQKGGTTIQAERILYSLDEGTATFEGSVRAVFEEPGE